MKAICYQKYGAPDVLTLQEVPKPKPKANEVLVRVHAASINSWDWDMVRGEPVIVRMWGLLKPKYKIPGADMAGTVEAVGALAEKFKPGDEVFGDLCENGFGAFAEYTCAKEDALMRRPQRMTFEEAAAIPQAGLMALQSIRDHGKVLSGQHVLMNGAGGGVGTFGIQLAKLAGAEVTAVDDAQKLERLYSLGADHGIDYRQKDFTKNGERYDLIIDVVSSRSVFTYRRSLNSSGTFLLVGGTLSAIFQSTVFGPIISRLGKQRLGIMPYRPNQGLDYLCELFETGKLKPVIDRVYSFHDTAEAFRYYASGEAVGKVVIRW